MIKLVKNKSKILLLYKMAEGVRLEYSLNVLDICAIIIAIFAILISVLIAYHTVNISSNTNKSVEHLAAIRTSLEKSS